MKNIVILLCLLFIAYSVPVSAQNQPAPAAALQDTLMIKLQNRNQVYIINRSLQRLTDYERADSLKNYFFADLEKTLAANDFPETPKRVYYLVSQAGKRRLKAEIPGETEPQFDLDFEKKRLTQDLPPLHYTIYDLARNVEIHYFLEDTSAVKMAANTPLSPAFAELKKDRKKLIGLTSYKLERGAQGFENRNPHRKTQFKIEVLSYLGAMLIGSQPSPLISFDVFASLGKNPGSALNHFRLGYSHNAFVLSDFKEGRFENINPGTYWHGILQSNMGLGKDNWLGITAGQFYTSNPNGLPNRAFKWGLMLNHNRDSFGFDGIELEPFKFQSGRRKQMYLFTYRRSIL